MRIDRPVGNESQLTGSFSGFVSGTFSGEVVGLSESLQEIQNTITQDSESIVQYVTSISQSFQTQVDEIKTNYITTQSFEQYQDRVDRTYYKNGSQAVLDSLLVNQNATVVGNVWVQGNVKVEGSSSVIHTEDVSIADHFVTIASGALDQQDANGAGFGIDGANVTMSYHYTSGSDEYVEINKPFKALSFLGTFIIDGGRATS